METGAGLQHTLRHGYHHGEPERRLDFADFSVMRLRYSPHFADAAHRHQHAAIVTPYDGIAYQCRNGSEEARVVGMHRYHPAYEVHAERVGPDGWSKVAVEMQPAWVAELHAHGPAFRSSFDVTAPDAHHLVRKIASALEAPRSPAAALCAQGLVLEFIAVLLDARDGVLPIVPPAWLRRARELIEATFRERPGLDAIARAVHVHPVHLARSFRRSYGETMGAFSRRLFADEARRLLADGNLSIAEIARRLGYSPSHFATLTRALFGASPRELRRRLPVLKTPGTVDDTCPPG